MSITKKVDDAFEEFREYLVTLVGDHHGVHSVIDDAKAAIAPHVQEEKPIEVVTGLGNSTMQSSQESVETSTLPEGSPLPTEDVSVPVTDAQLNKAIDEAITAAPIVAPTEEKPAT